MKRGREGVLERRGQARAALVIREEEALIKGTMCLNVLRCMGVSTVEKGDSDVEETNGRYAPAEEAAAARIHPSGNGQHNPPKNTTHAARHPSEQHHDEDEREAAGATRKGQIETTRAAASGSPVKAKKEEYPSEHSFPGTNKTNYKETPAPGQFNGAVAGQPRRGHDDDDGGDAYGNSRAAMSDSARELRSPVMAKKEESRPEQYSAGGANKTTDQEYSPAGRLNVVAGHPRRGGYDDEGLRVGTVPAGDAATYPGQYKAAHGAGDAYGNSTYMYIC